MPAGMFQWQPPYAKRSGRPSNLTRAWTGSTAGTKSMSLYDQMFHSGQQDAASKGPGAGAFVFAMDAAAGLSISLRE